MRIAVVNDSALAVAAMSRVLVAAPAHQIAWVARNGAEAVERCAHDTPDLILMDLVMPVMDGVEATRQIMIKTPCAILIVTATVGGNSGKIFQALGAGALDVVATPALGNDGAAGGAAALLSKIETLGSLISSNGVRSREPARPDLQRPPRKDSLVAIGASAGGPAAVATILAKLPSDFPAAIVVVQHVDDQFAPLMANWLNEQSRLPVRIAKQGDQPQPGIALMAATNDHLVFENARTLGYTAEPSTCSYRPSVDIFFYSLARHWKGEVVGVLLTGMGRDGAAGLKALRIADALTIAQDRDSCVVYGMPKAAADIGAAAEILSLGEIAPRIASVFSHAKAGL
jgi:two-component system response regulator WspF